MSEIAIPPALTVQTARGPVRCIVEGQGPALLAIHGAMGGAEQSWLLARALLGAAAPAWRVIAVARPGYPGTLLSLGRTPEAQADLHAAVLDALGEDRAVIAAVSAGGPSALQLALRHPDRCRALTLVSACTGRLATPPKVRRRMAVLRLLTAFPGVAAALRSRGARRPMASLERGVSDPTVRARALADPEACALVRALSVSAMDGLRDRLPGTLNDTDRYADLDRPPLDRIATPLLAIHGTADPVVPLSHAEAVAAGVQDADLLAIEGGEHLALFTHLQDIRGRTAAFLGALPPA